MEAGMRLTDGRDLVFDYPIGEQHTFLSLGPYWMHIWRDYSPVIPPRKAHLSHH